MLQRAKDDAKLWLATAEGADRCGIFAFDADGRFDGEPLESWRVRVGDDPRTAELRDGALEAESRRKPGLLAEFLRGRISVSAWFRRRLRAARSRCDTG